MGSLERRWRLLLTMALCLMTLLLALAWWGDAVAVDHCLDAGGCWDEAGSRCEFHDPRRCEPPRSD